jgi:hypothetical protein
MAAVLACGPGAVLSHRSAAAHWGLRPSERKAIDVSASGRRGRGIAGIDAHRGSNLTEHDVTRLEGIPCTTPSRTLLGLAATVDPSSLLRAIDRAEELRRFDGNQLRLLLERSDGHPGIGALRTAIEECGEPACTRSELEQRFLALCEVHGIPRPRTNASVEAGGELFEVDFHWPEQRLVVETDGYRFHSGARAFEADRRHDQLLALAGWRVLRFTWHQVTEDPEAVAATVRALLDPHSPGREHAGVGRIAAI